MIISKTIEKCYKIMLFTAFSMHSFCAVTTEKKGAHTTGMGDDNEQLTFQYYHPKNKLYFTEKEFEAIKGKKYDFEAHATLETIKGDANALFFTYLDRYIAWNIHEVAIGVIDADNNFTATEDQQNQDKFRTVEDLGSMVICLRERKFKQKETKKVKFVLKNQSGNFLRKDTFTCDPWTTWLELTLAVLYRNDFTIDAKRLSCNLNYVDKSGNTNTLAGNKEIKGKVLENKELIKNVKYFLLKVPDLDTDPKRSTNMPPDSHNGSGNALIKDGNIEPSGTKVDEINTDKKWYHALTSSALCQYACDQEWFIWVIVLTTAGNVVLGVATKLFKSKSSSSKHR